MNIKELKEQGWKITKRFHNEECYYYYSAEKGRNILTSDDGITFSGKINGEWVGLC